MKKTWLISVVALAVSVVFVSAAIAEQKPTPAPATASQEPKLEKFNGVVEKVDEASKDLLVQFHKEKIVFSVGDHTKITEGKKEVPFADLKKGMWASVAYRKEANKRIAELISVSMPEVQTKSTGPSEKTTEKK